MWQQLYKYKNLLSRESYADRPNSKWVTNISCIHIKQGTLYLSMIQNLYSNSIVAYKTGAEQTVSLVLEAIRLKMKQKKSLRSCSSTTAKAFNTPLKHIASRLKNAALRRPCQGKEILMTMPWRKTYSPSSKQNASAGTNMLPLPKPMR